jgi:DNA replication and repair protein RecF
LVSDASQTLVTCAVEADVPAGLRGVRYEVAGGEVRRVG